MLFGNWSVSLKHIIDGVHAWPEGIVATFGDQKAWIGCSWTVLVLSWWQPTGCHYEFSGKKWCSANTHIFLFLFRSNMRDVASAHSVTVVHMCILGNPYSKNQLNLTSFAYWLQVYIRVHTHYEDKLKPYDVTANREPECHFLWWCKP